MERIEDLRKPPVIGKFYLVPTVFYNYMGIDAAWPVIGPKHNDDKFLNFPYLHYHVDARFITETLWRRLDRSGYDATDVVTRRPLCSLACPRVYKNGIAQRASHPPRLWAVKRCARHWEPYPQGDQPSVMRLHHHFAGQQADYKDGQWLCPHRQVGLGSLVPDDDGFVTCPLHGLRINCATGRVAEQGAS